MDPSNLMLGDVVRDSPDLYRIVVNLKHVRGGRMFDLSRYGPPHSLGEAYLHKLDKCRHWSITLAINNPCWDLLTFVELDEY